MDRGAIAIAMITITKPDATMRYLVSSSNREWNRQFATTVDIRQLLTQLSGAHVRATGTGDQACMIRFAW